MIIRSFVWFIAGLFALGAHYLLFAYVNYASPLQLERSSGPPVTIIGGEQFAAIEQQLMRREEVKKEQTEEPVEKKEDVKSAEPQIVKQVETVKPIKVLESKVANEQALKKEKTNSASVQKDVKQKQPQPKNEEPKKVEKVQDPAKKKVQKTKKKQIARNKNNQQESKRRSAAVKKGGGNHGRQNSISGKAIKTRYVGKLHSHLLRYVRNPQCRQRKRGRAVIQFSISRSGKVIRAHVFKSSGERILDKEALSTVRRASPFPRIPKAMKAPETIRVPISLRFC